MIGTKQGSRIRLPLATEILQHRVQTFLEQPSRQTTHIPRPIIHRITLPLEPIQPLNWLMHQRQSTCIYWGNRDGQFELAGIGGADIIQGRIREGFTHIFRQMHSHFDAEFPRLRYVGGFQFSPRLNEDPFWADFGAYWLVLPQLEVFREGDQHYMALNLKLHPGEPLPLQIEKLLDFLETVVWNDADIDFTVPRYRRRLDAPGYAGWARIIAHALQKIRSGSFEKIVLARRSTFEFEEDLHPLEILKRLSQASPETYHFCFQPVPGSAFLGASPERLYRRVGRTIETEAVAGTRPRGTTESEDRQLAETLLHSPKDLREHDYVVQSIQEVLSSVCENYEVDAEISILKLTRVQHLCKKLRGQLRAKVSDAQIISRLHPTPAVGGYPTLNSEMEIENLEPFQRGWYAAPVGWISQNAAEFAVAIRTGLIEDHRLHLYSGAGIVEGSTAENEWDEIENKISNFLTIIQRMNGKQ